MANKMLDFNSNRKIQIEIQILIRLAIIKSDDDSLGLAEGYFCLAEVLQMETGLELTNLVWAKMLTFKVFFFSTLEISCDCYNFKRVIQLKTSKANNKLYKKCVRRS